MLYWHHKAVDNYASKCALSNIYIYIRLDIIEGIHYLDTRIHRTAAEKLPH